MREDFREGARKGSKKKGWNVCVCEGDRVGRKGEEEQKSITGKETKATSTKKTKMTTPNSW